MENKIYNSFFETSRVINLIHLHKYKELHNLKSNITVATMFNGATGSYLDDLSMGLLVLAIKNNKVKKNMPIIEVASERYAVALAVACNQLGNKLHLVMKKNIDYEYIKKLEFLGAKVVLVSSEYGFSGLISKAKQLEKTLDGYFLNYLDNEDNIEYHKLVTAPFILNALGEKLDIIVCGVSSGGTITGVGEYIKSWRGTDKVKVVAVEPYESCVISGGFAGKHGIDGLGIGFVPENYNSNIVDRVETITTGDAVITANELLKYEGIPASIASGAVVSVAKQLAKLPENKEKNILVFLPNRIYI